MSYAPTSSDVPQFEMRHRLALALEAANISVQAMANELAVTRNTVGNYLAGRTKPNRATLRVWALRCGVPLDWLENGTEPPVSDGGPGGEYAPWDSNPEPADSQIIPFIRPMTPVAA